MNNCSNCKHWEFPRVKSWGNDVTYGECRAVLHNDNYKFDSYPDEDLLRIFFYIFVRGYERLKELKNK